ncbi:hypothetical protein [Maribacter sp. 2308TA10-17]|uniref:hypothetical protein n=1 Tax=Maribacter sp. 2308TA10-17 TaxID=3386276 RepID=UPI0039BD6A64
MKTILRITFLSLIFLAFSCSKDDAPTPEPIAQPEPEPTPELVNQAPSQVSLLTPAADAENVDVRPTFSWEAATDSDGDAITYEIYADTIATPSTLIGTTTETNFEVDERLSLLENYSWNVVAKDGKGGESESIGQAFSTRTVRTSIATDAAAFGLRVAHSSVLFDDKVWVISGRTFDTDDTYLGEPNDIWNSEDGVNWTLVTSDASFSGRLRHSSVVFENKMWVLGGVVGTERSSEIWNSSDGINWTLVSNNSTLDFTDDKVIVFDNKLWLVNDNVWFSEDGIVWTLAYNGSERIRGSAVTFQDKMVVVNLKDSEVHISEDGFNWETIENNINTLLSSVSSIDDDIIVFDNKIWSLGSFENKLIYSEDGIIWSLANEASIIPYLFSHTTAVLNEKIWVIGGSEGSSTGLASVYFIN